MAKLTSSIQDIKAALDRLAEVDPTPENAMAMKAMVRDIKSRLERFEPQPQRK